MSNDLIDTDSSLDKKLQLRHLPITKAIDNFVLWVGEIFNWLWVILVAVIILNVILRYVFKNGMIELEELQWHLYSIGWLVGLSSTYIVDSHVRVDVLSERLDYRKKLWFELFGILILFLPFVSRASEIIGKKLELKIDNKIFLLNYNNSIYSNSINNGVIEIGNEVLIKFHDEKDSFEENEWIELYKLSENTFVEENESLKQVGAGAGLTDND